MFNKISNNIDKTKIAALMGILFVMPVYADLPDPTRPPDRFYSEALRGENESKGWFLSSILISPQRRVAVINGKALQTGDQLGDAYIVMIRPSEVILKSGNGEHTLSLLPNSLKIRSGKAGK